MASTAAVDVAEQSVLAAEGGEEGLPLGVVGTLEAEVDRDVLLHVDGGVGGEEDWSDAISKGAGGSGAQNAGRGRGRRGGRHGAARSDERRRRWRGGAASWRREGHGLVVAAARPRRRHGEARAAGAARGRAAWDGGGARARRPGLVRWRASSQRTHGQGRSESGRKGT